MTEIDEKFVDAAADALGIVIPPDSRDGVVTQVQRIAGLAALVMEFPLPETEDPITILRHDSKP